nr:caspase 3 [Halisarca dujardinii]
MSAPCTGQTKSDCSKEQPSGKEGSQEPPQEAPLPPLVQELVGQDVLDKLYAILTPAEEAKVKAQVQKEGQDDTDFDAYPLTSHPRGPAIIINNEHFDKMPSRPGTERDGKALLHLFTHFGFATTTYSDLSASQMKAVLEGVAKRNHTHTQCLVVAILSHGEEEGLLHGTDDVLIDIKELADLFTGHKCSTLVGKPKLFFIQACRGKMFDTPATGYELTDGLKSMITPEGSKKKRELLPEQADFVLSFSTVEGYVSWRNSVYGSWYVKSLVEVFMEFAGKEHLLDMLTEVGRRVAENQSQSGFKQIPALVSQLRKKLYFNPGQKKAVNLLNM